VGRLFRVVLVIAIAATGMRLFNSGDLEQPGDSVVADSRQTAIPLGESCENAAHWSKAQRFLGRRATLKGRIAAVTYRPDESGRPTWINVGASYPNDNRLDLIIWGRNRARFRSLLSRLSTGREVCAQGVVERYRGTYQIELTRPAQVRIH